MVYLKQSTAVTIKFGPFLDKTDGVSEETALTISQADIRLSKNGGNIAQTNNSAGATHDELGYYDIPLDTTDTNTLGTLRVIVHESSDALPVWQDFTVLSSEAYDTLIDDGVWEHLTASHNTAGSFGAKVGAIGTAADLSDAVWDESRSGHTTAGTFGENVLADTISISGDSVAADNLEATYDGTGYIDDYAPSQQQQLNNIAIGSSAVSTTATTAVITTGSETNSYVSTHARDTVYHQITDVAGTIDLYYEFDVGGNGIPSSVTMYGYANGSNDPIKVFGYNWGSTAWEQIGTIIGITGTTSVEHTFSMYTSHVGTGANLGKVRVRFQNTGLSSANWYTDQLYVSFTTSTQSVGYANGAIWVDTNNGTAGTTVYVNGTADNPVLTWADALTLSGSLGLTSFAISNGSVITLSSSIHSHTLYGVGYELNLNGQSISGSSITGAIVNGTGLNALASSASFERSKLETVSLGKCRMYACRIAETITLTEATDYFFDQCYSGIAGTSTPTLDYGASVGDTNVSFRHYSGGIEIENMGQTGDDLMSLEGWGQFILNANCTGGTLAPRGHFKKTDNSGGAVTISEDANFKTSTITIGNAQGSGTGNNQIVLASTASSVDGSYDPSMIMLVAGTGSGQSRLILQYDGATRTATVDRNWKVNPDTTTEYRVIAHIGREHVNEGLAQAGSSLGITLNTLASSSDDAYNNQIIFLRSGTGEDQVRVVEDYDGTTKVATVTEAWSTIPDSTTGYVMLPSYSCILSQVADSVWDEPLADHDTEDSVGNVLNDLTEESSDVYRFNANALSESPTGGGTSSEIADAVWDEVASGHVTGGSFGAEVQSHSTSTELLAHDAKLDIVDSNIDDILVDTGTTLPNQISALNDISTTEVGIEVDSSLASYDSPTKAEMDAGFAALNDPTATENADAVVAKVLTEPATGLSDKSVGAMLYHLFSRFFHNVTQTSTQQKVFKDDSVTVLGTMATSDDGTTQTKGKAS